MKNCDIIKLARDGNFPHSVVFDFGNFGCNKIFLKDLLKTIFCGQCHFEGCSVCNKINCDVHPDIIYINRGDESSISISKIKAIQSEIFVFPNESNYKVFVIENSEFMTIPAQNAFLKILEEPPNYVIFLLLCENVSALLPTIKSRVQIFRLYDQCKNEILEKNEDLLFLVKKLLEKILNKEKYEIIKIVSKMPMNKESFLFVIHGLIDNFLELFSKEDYECRQISKLITILYDFEKLIACNVNLNLLTTRFLSELLNNVENK